MLIADILDEVCTLKKCCEFIGIIVVCINEFLINKEVLVLTYRMVIRNSVCAAYICEFKECRVNVSFEQL